MKPAPAPLSLDFPAEANSLVAARESVRRHLEEARLDETAVYAVDLALEELVGNTIRYGYGAQSGGSIRVEVSIARDSVRVSISDDGGPFDPTRQPEPERPRDLESAPVGGRGVSMVRRLARAMHYRRRPEGNWTEVEVPRAAPSG